MTTLVQQNNNHNSTATVTTASLAIVLPGVATVGNAICVGFAYGSSAGTPSLTSVTDNLGNNYTINQNNARSGFSDNCGCATFFPLTNAPQTITVTCASTVSGTIAIFANAYEISPATAVDASTTNTTGSVTAFNATFTTTAINEFAFASVTGSGGPTWTQNNGWTQDFASPGDGVWFFHNILSSSGANSLNMTSSTANFYLWSLVSLTPAAPPPSNTAGPVPRVKFILP